MPRENKVSESYTGNKKIQDDTKISVEENDYIGDLTMITLIILSLNKFIIKINIFTIKFEIWKKICTKILQAINKNI